MCVWNLNKGLSHINLILIGATATVFTTATSSLYGQGSGPVLLSDIRCTGMETNLLECGHMAISPEVHCTHDHDVGVKCEGN